MLRIGLIVVHLLELFLYTKWFHAIDGSGFIDWLIFVLAVGLIIRAVIIALTMVIARVPYKPIATTFAAFAAEYFAAVRLYSFDALIGAPAVVSPKSAPDETHLPVLFIHGFTCNAGFWRKFLNYFSTRWGNHLATISLQPVFGNIDQYSDQIDDRINQLLAAASSKQCLIIAHSMGGLATRACLRNLNNHHKIKGVITLGTPHQGTLLAALAFSTNGKQMRRFSEWLKTLGESEHADKMPPFESLIGTHDNIVAPRECAVYDLAANTYMFGVTHLSMALNEPLMEWTFERLQRLSKD